MTSGTSYSPPPAFGRFKLLHQIGAGVLGPVFRTHDPGHERLVAVKAFTLDLTPEQAAALAAEFGRLAALGLDAPCVAAPVAAGIEAMVPYIASPYVPGESLDAAIRQYGPAPAGDAIRLVAHVADALDAAAHAGVHHGSLHPRDVIVTPGETHVTGFGVAQALERVGLHGPVRRPYVAPEREGGDEWGAPADIYSLAAIAYEVLTGRRALPGTDNPLPGLNDLRVHDVVALREVIESALDAEPGRRPPRARDFAAGFAAALSETGGAGAPAERVMDRRARKPRTRPPKLPGLDEPLSAPDGAARVRAKAAPPVVPPPAAPAVRAEPAPGPGPADEQTSPALGHEAAPAPADIRYVPVTDPADAGEAEPAAAPSAADVPLAEPAAEVALPEALKAAGAGALSEVVPDLPPADDLLPRLESPGETMDAELAAALDRLAADHGAGPTPAAIGIDIRVPGTSESGEAVDIAAVGASFDLAAETRLAYEPADDPAAPESSAPPAETAAEGAGGGDFALDLSALEKPSAPAEVRADIPLQLGSIGTPPSAEVPADAPAEPDLRSAAEEAAAEGAEPLRVFGRGRGAERRRPPSRFTRMESLPEPETPQEDEAAVPRAFEQSRPAPLPRPVPDFELLARPASSRTSAIPVLVGVAAGLIVGMAGGYWLGSRSSAPQPAPPSQTARPAPLPPASTVPAEAAGGSGVQAVQQPAASAAGPGAAAAPAARPPAAAPAIGALQVTSSQQANVFVDGERQGMTPRSLKGVPLGSHTVRVTRPGYVAEEQTVVLTAEEPTASLAFTLRRAGAAAPAGSVQAPAFKSVLTVVIESTPPGARIRIDGRDLGPTPLTVRQLRPGTHALELRLPGYKPWSQKLAVAAGDNRRITASLERDNIR